MRMQLLTVLVAAAVSCSCPTIGAVYNLKVVTDASPDYSDLDSMIQSITSRWETPAEKCWALFYWNHIARRQCTPMVLHGLACTDPIRQFNDYGYTMCSTISGINCAIWDAMGLPAKYWDITNHTVCEVQYDGRWHMYDNSLSAIYTLCDGRTIAGVEDIGRTGACAASRGKEEPGHIAKYHCLTATSANGFLTGSDTTRDLDQEYRCFNPNGLMYRPYFYDWDRGHRYILNLRHGESYVRHYQEQGDGPEYYVPNGGKDPDDGRFGLRGNGLRAWEPRLTAEGLKQDTESLVNVRAAATGGVVPARAGQPAEIVFRVEGANVVTSVVISADVSRDTEADAASMAVSTTNGLTWSQVWEAERTGRQTIDLKLVELVNGAYEVLVKLALKGQADAIHARLWNIRFETVTMLNAKTQPQLLLGKNTVYVGAGEQTGSVVLWPDLRGEAWKPLAVDSRNMVSEAEHPGYQGVMHAERANEEAHVTFRVDTPGDMTRLHYGGRLYNRAPQSHIDFLHSFDNGKTWTRDYSLTDTAMPWDVIHYVDVPAPKGVRSALVRYLLNGSEAGTNACSIYAVRMEANYRPADAVSEPLAVTFTWAERQEDYSLVERSHTEIISKLPAKYTVNVGGVDHPVVRSLRIGPVGTASAGYADGQDVGGEKFVGKWVTVGRNLAEGKPYIVSVPSGDDWGAGDPEGKKLTDGVVGPNYPGGVTPMYGLAWRQGETPEITVDLGEALACGAFRIHLAGGWPWWDALKGEVTDQVEVLTSTDGQDYTSQGFVHTRLRRKDVPVNHMLPDEETAGGWPFELLLPAPVQARYVRFRLTPQRIVCVSEVQVFDAVTYEPFDLRLALPDQYAAAVPKVLTQTGRPVTAETAARNASRPVGEPVLEPATLHSLGAYWIVQGDANANARVTVEYRQAGSGEWRGGPPLFRVEKGAHRNDKGQSKLAVPEDGWLFAGSVLFLQPDTAYELRLNLSDPDGGEAQQILQARTIGEPAIPANMRTRYVVPGDGGGSGTAEDPFRGLVEAQRNAAPGDLFILRAGVYPGTFTVDRSGVPGQPIVWRGEAGAILDGQGEAPERPGRIISANDAHDVWFEGLELRRGDYGLVGHNSARIVLRRCHIHDVDYGLTCTNNDQDTVQGWFVSDNVIEGPCTWPRSKGIEEQRGIQVTGTGHVVCYNRITGFADAIDTFPSQRCAAIDFHHNDISGMTDDGIEMDYSERNTRCFYNRLTNVFQGISEQPIYGGPVYILRNVLYNLGIETFKLHNSPSGALIMHNTSVKAGEPLLLYTNEPVRNCVFRNNLFLGTSGSFAYESTAPMINCDFDYDGFGGGPWTQFLKWNGQRYATFEEMRQSAPVYRHATLVDPASAFASGVLPPQTVEAFVAPAPDLRLRAGTAAIDAGEALPGINDGFAGVAPDLGAYEYGQELPHYGPR